MVKITMKSPVDYRLDGKVLHFARGVEYFVEDDIADSVFVSQFIKSREVVIQDTPKKRVVRRKKENADS